METKRYYIKPKWFLRFFLLIWISMVVFICYTAFNPVSFLTGVITIIGIVFIIAFIYFSQFVYFGKPVLELTDEELIYYLSPNNRRISFSDIITVTELNFGPKYVLSIFVQDSSVPIVISYVNPKGQELYLDIIKRANLPVDETSAQ